MKHLEMARTLLSWLPEGGLLSDDEWRRRHTAIMVVLWLGRPQPAELATWMGSFEMPVSRSAA